MITVAVFDTKSYDREHLEAAARDTPVRYRFLEHRLAADTAATAAAADAVCVFVNDRVDRACLDKLRLLGVRLVALRCAGFNNVDLAAAAEYGITVVRVPAYSPHAVAEHTLALLLALNRRIPRAYNRVREQNFSLGGLVGFDLHGKTVGLVGTGKIGKLTAALFAGFGMRLLVSDAYPDHDWAARIGATYVPFEQLLAESDIVSLHLPLTPQSRHLLNPTTFALMKRGAYVVNTSRGALIDAKALIRTLKSGHLGGAALDVYEEEEGVFFEDHSDDVLADDTLARLTTFPNVLITAHQAFLTAEALTAIAGVTTQNLTRLHAGRPFLDDTVVTA